MSERGESFDPVRMLNVASWRKLDDPEAEKDNLIRVVDEDEDYLYPISWFLPIQLPHEVEEAISETVHA